MSLESRHRFRSTSPRGARSMTSIGAQRGTSPELLARQVLADGLPSDVAVLNLNIPRDATPNTEFAGPCRVVSRTTCIACRREHAFPPIRCDCKSPPTVDADQLEVNSDIRAIVCDGVVSVTPLSWSMTAHTDWQPGAKYLDDGAPRSTR